MATVPGLLDADPNESLQYHQPALSFVLSGPPSGKKLPCQIYYPSESLTLLAGAATSEGNPPSFASYDSELPEVAEGRVATYASQPSKVVGWSRSWILALLSLVSFHSLWTAVLLSGGALLVSPLDNDAHASLASKTATAVSWQKEIYSAALILHILLFAGLLFRNAAALTTYSVVLVVVAICIVVFCTYDPLQFFVLMPVIPIRFITLKLRNLAVSVICNMGFATQLLNGLMKVRIVHRDPVIHDPSLRQANAAVRVYKNADPQLHPFEKPRELQRALVATKLERMFAKPLVGVLDGHRDAVRVMARCHTHLSQFFTGSCDGEIRHWDLQRRACLYSVRGHEGFVRGLVVSQDDRRMLSCGDDGVIKEWPLLNGALQPVEELDNCEESTGQLVQLYEDDVAPLKKKIDPSQTWQVDGPLTSVDHHWTEQQYLSTGENLCLWNTARATPISSFSWNSACDAIVSGRFNPADGHLVICCGADNVVGIFDVRAASRVQAIKLRMRSNVAVWNPMKPFDCLAANEDSCLYGFDMRNMKGAYMVYKDFTNAVMDCDYSPTGREFVAGSFDRTVRIFNCDGGRSREVYHSQRMQTVLACRYTADSRFVLSGSGDFCVRIWKNKAWEKLGPKPLREKATLAYREALKERFQYNSEVRKILKHRHVPRVLKKTIEKKRVMRAAKVKKEENIRKHSAPGQHEKIPEKQRPIVDVAHE